MGRPHFPPAEDRRGPTKSAPVRECAFDVGILGKSIALGVIKTSETNQCARAPYRPSRFRVSSEAGFE
jgi:hypothetical protein